MSEFDSDRFHRFVEELTSESANPDKIEMALYLLLCQVQWLEARVALANDLAALVALKYPTLAGKIRAETEKSAQRARTQG